MSQIYLYSLLISYLEIETPEKEICTMKWIVCVAQELVVCETYDMCVKNLQALHLNL